MRLCSCVFALLCFTLLQGCGGNNNTYNPSLVRQATALPQETFTLDVSPVSRTIAPGASATYIVTLRATNGFNRNVQLSLSELPDDTSGVFSPALVAPTADGAVSVLTLQTTAATPTPDTTPTPTPDAGTGNLAGTIRSLHRATLPGVSTLTITATGGGVTRTATVQLVIAAAD